MLKLNHDKTDFLVLMSPHQRRQFGDIQVRVEDNIIIPSRCVRNLGVQFDDHLTMESQVTSIIKSCNFHLRRIGMIRQYLTTEACRTAVQSLVVSRLDYCCTLLSGITGSQLQRLQRVQNNAARVIACVPRNDHISPVLLDLHWLPCEKRIRFRIVTYVYKCLHNMAPHYLQELLQIYTPSRVLRSASDSTLLVTFPPKKRAGRSAFLHVAPALWNNLPQAVRDSPSLFVFKKCLKTYFFESFVQ